MATYTTNLNLKKPAQSDKIRIADINNNMDDIDAAFGAVGNDSVATQLGDIQGAIAIVATGNAHAAITSGQYVYVKSHDTLDTGLYVASSNISENGTLSSSNLTADTSGGLNDLNSKINTVNTKVTQNYDKAIKPVGGYFTEKASFKCRKYGNCIAFTGYIQITTQVPATTQFADIQHRGASGCLLFYAASSNNHVVLADNGYITSDDAIPTGYYRFIGALTVSA